jgi:TonB family protein
MHSLRVCHLYVVALAVLSLGTSTGASKQARHFLATAIDVEGRRYVGTRAIHGPKDPWITDRIIFRRPDYPLDDRSARHEGQGLFRIILDTKTGLVTQVTVIESTGFASLDTSAIQALRMWRFKPGKWKQIDMPVEFEMAW